MAAAILAGGRSSRMGADKGGLRHPNGLTMVGHLCRELQDFKEILIMSGNKIPEKYRYTADDIRCVPDVTPGAGPIAGIAAALAASKYEYVFVTACDMPAVDIQLSRQMAEMIIKTETDVLIAVDENGRLHPLCGIYHRRCLPVMEEALALGNRKLMCVLEQLNVKTFPVSAGQVFNMNTKEDYERFIKNWEDHGGLWF